MTGHSIREVHDTGSTHMGTYVLNDTGVQVFPEFLRSENIRLSQIRSVDGLNPRPPHQFLSREALHQCTVRTQSAGLVRRIEIGHELLQIQSWKRWVVEQTVEHVRLFVIVRCKNNIIHYAF